MKEKTDEREQDSVRYGDDLIALLAITRAQAEMERIAPWSFDEAHNIFATLA